MLKNNIISDFFTIMSKEELELFESTKCSVVYMPDEIIVKQGTKTSQFPVLVEGFAKAYIEGIDEKCFTLGFIKPNEYVILPGAYVDGIHHYSIKAIEKSICCFYDFKTFIDIAHNNVKIYEKIVELNSQNALNFFNKFISLTQKHVNGRLAEALIYLQKEIFDDSPIDYHLSSKDLAEMTGMTKDTTVRILKDLKENGIIEMNNNDINIIDYKRLEKISEIG